MFKFLSALRRTALATIIGAGFFGLSVGAGTGSACDCNGGSYGDPPPYYGPSSGDYPCYGRCDYGSYDRQVYGRYDDSYYDYERLDPYRYYNPDYDDEYADGGDCDDDDCN